MNHSLSADRLNQIIKDALFHHRNDMWPLPLIENEIKQQLNEQYPNWKKVGLNVKGAIKAFYSLEKQKKSFIQQYQNCTTEDIDIEDELKFDVNSIKKIDKVSNKLLEDLKNPKRTSFVKTSFDNNKNCIHQTRLKLQKLERKTFNFKSLNIPTEFPVIFFTTQELEDHLKNDWNSTLDRTWEAIPSNSSTKHIGTILNRISKIVHVKNKKSRVINPSTYCTAIWALCDSEEDAKRLEEFFQIGDDKEDIWANFIKKLNNYLDSNPLLYNNLGPQKRCLKITEEMELPKKYNSFSIQKIEYILFKKAIPKTGEQQESVQKYGEQFPSHRKTVKAFIKYLIKKGTIQYDCPEAIDKGHFCRETAITILEEWNKLI